MHRYLLICAFILSSSQAFAKPAEIASVIHAEEAYGQGTYSAFLIKAYDASLWTDAKTWSMKAPFALSLHYRLHFTTEQLVTRSIEEIERAHALSEAQKTTYATQLTTVFHDVNAGDTITALFVPGKGTNFYYNGNLTSKLNNSELEERFLGIWLAPETSAPELRRSLLSKGPDHDL